MFKRYTMKYKHIENISIAVTVIMFGIMAGFFWTYTFNVNIAMLQVDGPTYGRMQSLFNQNVRHVMFFLFFFGAGAASFLTVIVNYKHFRKVSFWLCALSSIIYIFGIIVFTAQVNLPLNYYTESWDLLNLPQDLLKKILKKLS